jgi:putative membrane protein
LHDFIHQLPHVNAALNSLAAMLLVLGYVLIKQRREIAHRNVMLAAFATSVVFLTCYLTHHIVMQIETGDASKRFPTHYGDAIRYLYYALLLTHVVLAAAVPFLAVWTIYLGLTDQRKRHNYWAWRTFPIWLYVSVTGVIVYLMLYQLYPELPAAP